jgi:hypothetical protein
MSKYKREPLPSLDGVAFSEMLEQAVEDGNADLISAKLPKLIRFIKMYQDRIYQFVKIPFRARTIYEQHDPSAADSRQETVWQV